LGSSFVGALAYTFFRITFGLIGRGRSVCNGITVNLTTVLAWITMGTRNRHLGQQMVADHLSSGFVFFGVHFMAALLTIPAISFYTILKITKLLRLKTFIIANVVCGFGSFYLF
jgi:hypothetical protein